MQGTVADVPRSGAIGIFIDLTTAAGGIVDVLQLPIGVEHWSAVDTVAEFEILQQLPGQTRLWPLDLRWRRHPGPPNGVTDDAWAQTRRRYRPGQLVPGRTTSVFAYNREKA